MSSSVPVPGGITDPQDPKNLILVDTIIKKTGEKKLYWNKTKTGYVAMVSSQPLVQMLSLIHI